MEKREWEEENGRTRKGRGEWEEKNWKKSSLRKQATAKKTKNFEKHIYIYIFGENLVRRWHDRKICCICYLCVVVFGFQNANANGPCFVKATKSMVCLSSRQRLCKHKTMLLAVFCTSRVGKVKFTPPTASLLFFFSKEDYLRPFLRVNRSSSHRVSLAVLRAPKQKM